MKAKKILTSPLAAILTVSAVPFTASASAVTEQYEAIVEGIKNGTYNADFNCDGKLTYADADALLKFYSLLEISAINRDGSVIEGKSVGLSEESLKLIASNGNIDCDEENTVDSDDASFLMQIIKDITLPGDANSDGKIDSDDASLILSAYAFKQTSDPSSTIEDDAWIEYQSIILVSDIDNDGAVDSDDASFALAIYAENQTK